MAIPAVIQGTVEVEGKVFELDSPKGATWLETIGSFRFEPAGNSKPCTVRREPSGYWYGCRKIAGKVRKKYIGKSSEVSTAKLEEIAAALEVPPVPRVAQVAQVAEVAQKVAQDMRVAEKVAEVAEDRLTALELEVADLRKALEVLLERLPGKSEAGDSAELLKVDSKVAEGLQNELGNLKMKAVESDLDTSVYDALVDTESAKKSAAVYGFTSDEALADAYFQINMLTSNYDELEDRYEATKQELAELRSQLETERADREEVETELSDLKQKSAAASKDLPEAADLLNQLKSKRKKSTTTLADLEVILEILES